MPNVSLGQAFEDFIEAQIAQGRFQNASEVVRAGLRLLQEHELTVAERQARLAREINQAFDDIEGDASMEDVFQRLEREYEADARPLRHGAA